MSELDRLSDKLHIPRAIKENAALIYRRALKEGLTQGRSIAGIVAASLYAACRLTKTPRTLREVVEASTKGRKKISQCYRLIKSRLNMKMPIDGPVKYVPKIASKTHLDPKTERHAIKILREAKKKKTIIGKIPMGVAAAALYIAARLQGEAITQSGVAEAAEVSAVTVRNHYKELIEDLNLDLGKDSKG
jgi:transcription initiation factor TFIIB